MHENEENANKSKGLICQFCSKSFSLLSNMKRHEREIHFRTKYNLDFYEGFEPAKFFQCETCEQKFARKTKLKRHIMKYTLRKIMLVHNVETNLE